VFRAISDAIDSADWLVASGSLPPGAPADVYADLVRGLAGSGIRVAVDTSGPALEAVLAAGPTLVKPNRDELAEVSGQPLTTIADVVEAASRLRDRGAGAVLASLGREGAVLVDEDGAIHGSTPEVLPLSSVGAGDAMLAGFLAGGGNGAKALLEGLAWGAAAVLQPGSGMPSPADIDRSAVRLERHGSQRRDLLAMPP
jgi:1-phosphofructokinase